MLRPPLCLRLRATCSYSHHYTAARHVTSSSSLLQSLSHSRLLSPLALASRLESPHQHTLSTFTSFHTPLPLFHARAPVARSRCTASRLERVAPFLQRLQSQVSSSGSCQRPAQLRWYAALQASQQRRSPVCVVVLAFEVRWGCCFVLCGGATHAEHVRTIREEGFTHHRHTNCIYTHRCSCSCSRRPRSGPSAARASPNCA